MSPAIVFGVLLVLLIVRMRSRRRKLPPGCKPIPGPPGLPVIGNLHQIPSDYPWRKFKEWSDIYGPIMEVKLGSESLIVLSDDNTAREILERRGQKYHCSWKLSNNFELTVISYSSRPQTYMACEVLSGNLRPLLLPYGGMSSNS